MVAVVASISYDIEVGGIATHYSLKEGFVVCRYICSKIVLLMKIFFKSDGFFSGKWRAVVV